MSAMDGSCLTTNDALPLLVASVYPTSAAVFAPACLAGTVRVWHLGVLPMRWPLTGPRRALR